MFVALFICKSLKICHFDICSTTKSLSRVCVFVSNKSRNNYECNKDNKEYRIAANGAKDFSINAINAKCE